MTFRKRKPDYDHIAQLERELDLDDESLLGDITRAAEAARPKQKQFFKPPILEKRTSLPVVPVFAMSSTASGYKSDVTSLLLGVPGVNPGG